MPAYVSLIDQYQSDHNDCRDEQFAPGKSFVIREISDAQKHNGDDSTVHEISRADLPSRLICVDGSDLQTQYENSCRK